MDRLLKNLSDADLKKMAKGDHQLLIDLQKEIHSQKAEHYEKLKNFYWTIAIAILLGLLGTLMIVDKAYFTTYFLLMIIAFILATIGGKIYFINKPEITQKAIKKSKLLDAMQIETMSPEELKKKNLGLGIIISAVIIYLFAIVLAFIR